MRDQFSVTDISRGAKALFYPVFALGTISIALQFVNAIFWNRFWAFFAIICYHLIIAVVQFLRIILLPPDQGTSER